MTWILRDGQTSGKGYAATSASMHLVTVAVSLRQRGCALTRDDQAAARKALDGLAVRLLQEGERRGRGQAVAAEMPDLYRVVRACPDTLAGARDKALIPSRAQDPAGLLAGDVALTPRGMVVSVINRQDDPEICPVEACTAYRACLAAEAPPRWSEPTAPAFVGVDRHGGASAAWSRTP
ncbi:hypothetical protein [Streptomyces sp. NPDC057403]|uniref:hypothetical protein n=1 Tax=Streptomyces sp. NPDC057403 TaxID=3346119 RepID=UPI0036B7829B